MTTMMIIITNYYNTQTHNVGKASTNAVSFHYIYIHTYAYAYIYIYIYIYIMALITIPPHNYNKPLN